MCPFGALQMEQPRIRLGLGFPQAMISIYDGGPWIDVPTLFPQVASFKQRKRIELYLATACVIKKSMERVEPVFAIDPDRLDQIGARLHSRLNSELSAEVNQLRARAPSLDEGLQKLLRLQVPGDDTFLNFITTPSDTVFHEVRDIGHFLQDELGADNPGITDALRLTGRKARNLRILLMSRVFDFFKHSAPKLHEDEDLFKPLRRDVLSLMEDKEGGVYADIVDEAIWSYVEAILSDKDNDTPRIGCPAGLAGAIPRAYNLAAESIEVSESAGPTTLLTSS